MPLSTVWKHFARIFVPLTATIFTEELDGQIGISAHLPENKKERKKSQKYFSSHPIIQLKLSPAASLWSKQTKARREGLFETETAAVAKIPAAHSQPPARGKGPSCACCS
jgi:hypothetical protein